MVIGAVVAKLALAAAPAPPLSVQLIEKGEAAYGTNCLACHGATGEGNGPLAFSQKPPPRNFKTDPFKAGDSVEQIYFTITNGLPQTAMVGWPKLSDDERWGLAYLVRSVRPKP